MISHIVGGGRGCLEYPREAFRFAGGGLLRSFIRFLRCLRGKDTIEFLGLWEQLHNPNFKPIEFDRFRAQAGYNAFTLSPQKWIDKTSAIGIVSKAGRYGGTFAHSDIAFEFASWISLESATGISEYGKLQCYFDRTRQVSARATSASEQISYSAVRSAQVAKAGCN